MNELDLPDPGESVLEDRLAGLLDSRDVLLPASSGVTITEHDDGLRIIDEDQHPASTDHPGDDRG